MPQGSCLKPKYLLFFAIFVFATTANAGYPADAFDKKAVIQLLKDENFDRLDQVLSDLQVAYEKGKRDELEVAHAFDAFGNSDPELEARLNAWLKQKPNSFAAHLANAEYHMNIGWHARGGRWAKDTQEKQFAKMKAYFRVAGEEFNRVIMINPQVMPAYRGLIRRSYAFEGNDVTEQIVRQGLKIRPASYLIHYQYLWSLQPKWGGSLQQIEKHLESIRQYYTTNPRLRNLEAYPDYVEANQIPWRECQNATSIFNEALKKGDLAHVYKERGNNHRCLGNKQAAIKDFSTAIKLSPQSSGYLRSRGYMYYRMKEYQQALSDFDEAIALDRMNPKALRDRGNVYYAMNRPNSALQDLNDALSYGSYDGRTHKYLGYVYYYQKKSYATAANHLKEAIELGESHPFTQYLLTASLWHERDCALVGEAKKYAKMCSDNPKCKVKNVEWARKSADHAVNNNICPDISPLDKKPLDNKSEEEDSILAIIENMIYDIYKGTQKLCDILKFC